MSLQQKKIIMNAFITSQFGYRPLIWMCHSRKIHRQIDKIHERALRIVYMDNVSSFDELLVKSKSVSIHTRNLQHLAIEIYKALHNLSSFLMSEIFRTKKVITVFEMMQYLSPTVQYPQCMELNVFPI